MAVEVGDLCFAHLKGYKPSPAKILNVGKKSVQVEWLESGKTSLVDKRKLRDISEDNLNALVTEKTMKDTVFAKGIQKLVSLIELDSVTLRNYFPLQKPEPPIQPGTTLVCSMKSDPPQTASEHHHHTQDSIEGTLVDEGNLQDSEGESESSVQEKNPEVSSKKEKGKQIKKSKKKADTTKKRVTKTLQESEVECNKKFFEKIKEEHGGYICKDCDFSTAWRLSARSHVLTCGLGAKKRSRRKKNICCSQCDEKFISKKLLNKHFKTEHSKALYTCSSCGKKFKCKQYLMNHLKIHDTTYLPTFKCEVCEYRTKDQWHMNRHKKRKHPNNKEVVVKTSPEDRTMVQAGGSASFRKVEDKELSPCGSEVPGDGDTADVLMEQDLPVKVVEETGHNHYHEVSYDLGPADCAGRLFSHENIVETVTLESLEVTEESLWEDYFNEHSHIIDNLTEYLFGGEDIVSSILNEVLDSLVDSQQMLVQSLVTDLIFGVISSVIEVSEAKRFICPFCGQKYRDNYNLKTHIANVHDVGEISCFLCGNLFSDKLLLRSHRQTCSLFCSETGCNKSFKRKDKYRSHIKNHQKQLLRFS